MLYFLVILVALLLVVILIFNGLVRKRNAADFAFSCIDAQLAKRFDLVPRIRAYFHITNAERANPGAAVS